MKLLSVQHCHKRKILHHMHQEAGRNKGGDVTLSNGELGKPSNRSASVSHDGHVQRTGSPAHVLRL